MTRKNYRADQMSEFDARIKNAESETQTQAGADGGIGFWQAVFYESGQPFLATVPNCLMGGEETGYIEQITEAKARKALAWE